MRLPLLSAREGGEKTPSQDNRQMRPPHPDVMPDFCIQDPIDFQKFSEQLFCLETSRFTALMR
ncbi:hypothetical protein CSB45_11160 [candidate division KSB3 bacterium]|uniref:Uncharacterized protein n=1 Tax=candidate division KSB3 bacterium TaxID=2044937 RepID=A0A2G6E3B1_9BACT|nr:MAG: hypothetical protein CSB45_11160 [candidate division KSB3 bacterium]PIE29033.1 MAG: hypothetical protein CSA57_10445 [candidate division KSB3 bacterium]